MADSKYQEKYAEGSYELEVLDNTFAEGPKGPYLMVKAKVLKMEKAKNGAPIPQQIMDGHRYVSLFFTEGTLDRTKDFLRSAGYRGNDLRVLDGNHPNHVSLAGYKFRAGCTNETYNGKTRDKFAPYSDDSGNKKWMENIKPASQTKLMGLNALWNSANTGIPSSSHIQAAGEPPPFAPDSAKADSMDFNSWD